MNTTQALGLYRQVDVHSKLEDANTHKVIQLLLEGVLEKILLAKNAIQRQDIAAKGLNISMSITIIDALRSSLDLEKGGEIAQNLSSLYSYIMEILLRANLETSLVLLDEASSLLSTIKSGWDAIEAEAKAILEQKG